MIGLPIRMPGPEGQWDQVPQQLADNGCAVVYATWQDWLPAALAEPPPTAGTDRGARCVPRMATASARLRAVTSGLLASYVAAAALGVARRSVELARGPDGHPYVPGRESLRVCLSNTVDLLVVGLNRAGPIGVDVRLADRPVSISEVGPQVCTAGELAALAALPPARQQRELVRLWTLKEACRRALGPGAGLRLPELGLGIEVGQPRVLPGLPDEWMVTPFLLAGRYVVGVAAVRPHGYARRSVSSGSGPSG